MDVNVKGIYEYFDFHYILIIIHRNVILLLDFDYYYIDL